MSNALGKSFLLIRPYSKSYPDNKIPFLEEKLTHGNTKKKKYLPYSQEINFTSQKKHDINRRELIGGLETRQEQPVNFLKIPSPQPWTKTNDVMTTISANTAY